MKEEIKNVEAEITYYAAIAYALLYLASVISVCTAQQCLKWMLIYTSKPHARVNEMYFGSIHAKAKIRKIGISLFVSIFSLCS
ncbi:hypothetical protein [Paenibacillus amylolyticus]|uniref:hypothetical protein n=1 Tax=Paenibacillus amylolyticus TaxID=1451 RepID=UPI00339429AE